MAPRGRAAPPAKMAHRASAATPVGAAGPGSHPPAASIVDAHRFGEAADAPSPRRPLRPSARPSVRTRPGPLNPEKRESRAGGDNMGHKSRPCVACRAMSPRKVQNARTGRGGWAPRCANEWKPGVCAKARLVPQPGVRGAGREELLAHLQGRRRWGSPLLTDDTCWLLAINLDGGTWRQNVGAVRDACGQLGVVPAVERHCAVGYGGACLVLLRRAGARRRWPAGSGCSS